MPTSLRDRRARPGPARRLRSLVHAARTPQERVLALQRTIGNRVDDRSAAELKDRPTQWVFEPGAIETINADGFFFRID